MRVTTTEKNERFAPCNINEVIIITCFWVAQTKIEKRFDINMVHVVNECLEELVIVVNIYHCEIFYACNDTYWSGTT